MMVEGGPDETHFWRFGSERNDAFAAAGLVGGPRALTPACVFMRRVLSPATGRTIGCLEAASASATGTARWSPMATRQPSARRAGGVSSRGHQTRRTPW